MGRYLYHLSHCPRASYKEFQSAYVETCPQIGHTVRYPQQINKYKKLTVILTSCHMTCEIRQCTRHTLPAKWALFIQDRELLYFLKIFYSSFNFATLHFLWAANFLSLYTCCWDLTLFAKWQHELINSFRVRDVPSVSLKN